MSARRSFQPYPAEIPGGAPAAGGGSSLSTPAYGQVTSDGTRTVLAGAPVVFDFFGGSPPGAPSSGITTTSTGFTATAAGTYFYQFQVVGTPAVSANPLLFRVNSSGAAGAQQLYTSESLAEEAEIANGSGYLTLAIGDVVTLVNEGSGTVTLTSSGVIPGTVNASLSLTKVSSP